MAQDGNAIQCASAELKADRDVVLAAVAQDGCAVRHASVAMQSDREVSS